jgi:hypothetical protein
MSMFSSWQCISHRFIEHYEHEYPPISSKLSNVATPWLWALHDISPTAEFIPLYGMLRL